MDNKTMLSVTDVADLNRVDDSPKLPGWLVVDEGPGRTAAVLEFGSGFLVVGPGRSSAENVRELAERAARRMVSNPRDGSEADAPDGRFVMRAEPVVFGQGSVSSVPAVVYEGRAVVPVGPEFDLVGRAGEAARRFAYLPEALAALFGRPTVERSDEADEADEADDRELVGV